MFTSFVHLIKATNAINSLNRTFSWLWLTNLFCSTLVHQGAHFPGGKVLVGKSSQARHFVPRLQSRSLGAITTRRVTVCSQLGWLTSKFSLDRIHQFWYNLYLITLARKQCVTSLGWADAILLIRHFYLLVLTHSLTGPLLICACVLAHLMSRAHLLAHL